jgi:hypothetical protein
LLAARARSVRHALDAVRQRAPVSIAGGLVLILGAALVAVLLGELIQNARIMHEFEARLNGMRPTQPVATAPAWRREELSKVRAVNKAVRELNLPIAAILRALRPPRDIRVAVLGVDAASSEAQSIKIVAEAASGAEMARYVGVISGREPFSAAYLIKHEIDEKSPGRPYRFTVDAPWRG